MSTMRAASREEGSGVGVPTGRFTGGSPIAAPTVGGVRRVELAYRAHADPFRCYRRKAPRVGPPGPGCFPWSPGQVIAENLLLLRPVGVEPEPSDLLGQFGLVRGGAAVTPPPGNPGSARLLTPV
jgi:hypothetical protein